MKIIISSSSIICSCYILIKGTRNVYITRHTVADDINTNTWEYTHKALAQWLQAMLEHWYIKPVYTDHSLWLQLAVNSHKLTCMIYSWYVNIKLYNSSGLEWKHWRIYVYLTPLPASKQTVSHLSVCEQVCRRLNILFSYVWPKWFHSLRRSPKPRAPSNC